MTMLELVKNELDKKKALTPRTNDYIDNIVKAIPFPTVPLQMKSVIAVSQLTNFAAQFRRNIKLWDGSTEVPVNAISFVISGSGAGKDSSVNAARKCFKSGYELIENTRYREVVKDAIKAADVAEEEFPDDYATYKKYMKPIPPIDITPSTGPGLIKHVNDIADLGITSGFMYSGEFSDELAQSPDMVENIKILSELYDLGIKNATYTKGAEHRAEAIEGQPVSALFVGSPGHILYDEGTKKKFNVAFMSKLARRSWFCYTPNKIAEPDFMDEDDPIEAFEQYEMAIEVESKQAISVYNTLIKDICTHNLKFVGNPIETTEEVFRLFKLYKRYNNDLADTYHNQDSTYTLIRRHLQWKALKLAGAFAIMDKSHEILEHHYIDAMRFCEMLDDDMNRFEYDLNKAYHERFSDWIRTEVGQDGKATVNIHDIKKHGYLSSVSKTKLQELVTLAAGYDTSGIYTVVNEATAIQYEPIIKTEFLNVSYKEIDNTELNKVIEKYKGDYSSEAKKALTEVKHSIAATTAYGIEQQEVTFTDLADLLSGDFAYSPFKFKDGARGRDNVIGGTKWMVFDVDDSPLSASETHIMLGDINHHIALSSDPDNEYKYRILIEFDSHVNISAQAWKYFSADVAKDLAIKVDPLPQSQVFFSYSGREVYSQTDSSPLEIRDYVMRALEKESNNEIETKVSTKQAQSMLSDALSTFNYAFEAPNGQGSRSMIRAAYHAKDLGASREDTLQLVQDINDYWYASMPEERLNKILGQIHRMF